jgi:hypothetical protein
MKMKMDDPSGSTIAKAGSKGGAADCGWRGRTAEPAPTIDTLTFEPSLGDVNLPEPPASSSPRKAGPDMEPVVRAATGERKIKLFDLFLGH